MLCTVVGTVSHELGHCAEASLQGRGWELHYAFMYPERIPFHKLLDNEYQKNKNKIDSELPSPEKEEYINSGKDS